MELVLKDVDRKHFLDGVDEKKRQEQQKEEVVGNVVIYDPKPQEVMDSVVSEKMLLLKTARAEKGKAEKTEIKKFMNALTLTNVQATIKKAGFHPDGSPKVAIAGLFDRDVGFIVRDGQAKYCSDSLSVILADVKNDWKKLIVFFVGLAGVLASVFISFTALFEDLGFYGDIVLFIVGAVIPCGTLVFVIINASQKGGSYYTNVPPAPESVLTKISGHGPFAILFEVTEGWRKVKPDPVILRIINIDGQQFFEPVVGYDMTPLEKSSLVET